MAIETIQVTSEDIKVTLTDVGIRGRAGLVFRGDYSDTTQYYQGDAVRFNSNMYISVGSPSIGDDPDDDTTNWEVLVFGSPTSTNIVEFYTQPSDSSVITVEQGDLVRATSGKYFWVTTASTSLNSSTTFTSGYELRGNPINTVGTGDISSRPTSGTEIGDFWVTTEGESSIWDGTNWLEVHTKLVSSTDNGLMSNTDKVKLDGIEALAEANNQVTIDYDDASRIITVTSTEDGATVTSTDTLPRATDTVEGLVKVDTSTLSITNGTISASETLELGKLSDITAPTLVESGLVLRGRNNGVDITYDWISNNDQTQSIREWDTTGLTNYVDQTVGTPAVLGLVTGTFNGGANSFTLTENSDGSWTDTNDLGGSVIITLAEVESKVNDPVAAGLIIISENLSNRSPTILGGSSIVEFSEKLYLALEDIDYETNGSCAVNGVDSPGTANRTNCEATPNGVWTITNPSEDSKWDLIGPGSIEELNDVDTSVAEGDWATQDSPILARVGSEWRLFPGLDSLDNIGDIPTPTTSQAGFVLRTDGAADPTYSWTDQVARIQVFSNTATYLQGDMVRLIDTVTPTNSKIFLAVSENAIQPVAGINGGVLFDPTDGVEWQTVGPETIEELNDTVITTPANGNVLTFSNGSWRNLTANAAIAAALDLTEIGDIPDNSAKDKVLVSTGTLDSNQNRYTWEDYGRDIKNVQVFDTNEDYLAGDLVEHQNKLYIAVASVNSPVATPLGNDTDAVWKQLGASSLVNIEGIDDPSTIGQVLAYTGDINSVPQFGWTTEIETAARVPAFASNEAYAEGALVTTGTGTNLSVFIALKAVSASSTTPSDDGVNWEILGPEKVSNLEDVTLTSLGDNEILQYNNSSDIWENKTPAEFGADMILANIGDVTTPTSTDDANKVLQVTFSGSTPTYAWVDRTTNTTTIQGHSTTKSYSAGEIVFHSNAIYLAIGSATNLNKVPAAVGSDSFWQLIGPETFEELEDYSAGAVDPTDDQFLAYDATATANDGTTGAWRPVNLNTLANSGDTLGATVIKTGNNITFTIDASAYPTLSDFQDKTTVGDTLGVNFINTAGVLTADVDASVYTKDGDFSTTSSSRTGDNLTVDFTIATDSVTGTVDVGDIYTKTEADTQFAEAAQGALADSALQSIPNWVTDTDYKSGFVVTHDDIIYRTKIAISGESTDNNPSSDTTRWDAITLDAYTKTESDAKFTEHTDFNDTANVDDTLGIDFTASASGVTGTVDASDYAQHGDFKDTTNSGDTLGVNFTGADDNITATVDASSYPTLTDFQDKTNSGDTLGVNFINTSGVITADIDASAYPKTTDFNDTANSGDNLGVDFTVDAGGDISAIIDASDYTQHGDFKDTANSGDTLGVNFTGADDNITATVDASSYPTLSDFQDTSNTGDTLGVNFTNTSGIITATIDVAGVSDLTEYTTGRNYSEGDTVWLSDDNKIYRNTTSITNAPSTFDSSDWQVLSGDSVWDGTSGSLGSTTFLDGRFTQPEDFNDTANSGDTLGIDFTATSGGVVGTVDASQYVENSDFADTANSGKTLGVDFTATTDNIIGTVDVDGFYNKTETDAKFTEHTDFSDTANSGDTLGIDFTATATGVVGTVDASQYVENSDFSDTANSGKTLGIDFTTATDSITGTVDASNFYNKSESDSLFLSTGEEAIIPFNSSISYTTNDLVVFSGAVYRAIQSIAAPVSPATLSNPDSDTTNWIEMTHDTKLEELSDVVTAIAADDGRVLSYDHTNSDFRWIDKDAATATIQAYDSSDAYNVGDLVTHSNSIYLALKANDGDAATTSVPQVTPGTDETTWETLGPESIEKLTGVTITSGATNDLLHRTGADTWENITPIAMIEASVDFTDLRDIDFTPAANQLLQRNAANDGWSIVDPSVIAEAGIAFTDLSDIDFTPAANQLVQRNSANTAWEVLTPAQIAEAGISFTDLSDIDFTPAANQLVQRNSTNTGWIVQTPAQVAEDGIALTDLSDIDVTATADQLLQRNAGNTAWEATTLATATNAATNGVKARDLSDVDDSDPSDNQVLQYDSTGTKYSPVGTDEVLKTGKLGSLKDVPSPDISATGSSEIGKVLTVRATSGSPDYKWESPTTASIQSFDTGSSTSVSAYAAGDIVEHDKKIWIATTAIANVLPAVNPAPGSTNAGNDWDLVGPETVDQLNDVNIDTIANDDFLQRKGGEWVNRTVSEVSAEIDLTSLKDVDQDDTVADQDFLKYSTTGNEWKFTSEVGNINDVLSDVNIGDTGNTLKDKEVLTYDSGTNRWVNSTLGTLGSLSDTSITDGSVGQVLEYDGTNWVNKFRGFDDSTPGVEFSAEVIDSSVNLFSAFPFETNNLRFNNGLDAETFMGAIGSTGDTFSVGSNFRLRSGINGAAQDFGGATFTRINNEIAVTNITINQVLAPGSNLFFQVDAGAEGSLTVLLDRFDGQLVRRITEDSSGRSIINLVTDAITSVDSILDPEATIINWDASGTGLDVDFAVTGTNDELFKDRYLNSIDKVELEELNGSGTIVSTATVTSTVFPASPSTSFVSSITNDDGTNNVYRLADPRTGAGFNVAVDTDIKATLTDNDSANTQTSKKRVVFSGIDFDLEVSPSTVTKSFLDNSTTDVTVTATLLNTTDGANTSVVASTYEGSANALTRSDKVYSSTISSVAFNEGNLSDTASVEIEFTKGVSTVDVTKTATVSFTPTYPVLHGFSNQNVTPDAATVAGYTQVVVAEDGTGIKREYDTITNGSTDQTLWFAFREVDGSTDLGVLNSPKFATRSPGGTDHIIDPISIKSLAKTAKIDARTIESVTTGFVRYTINGVTITDIDLLSSDSNAQAAVKIRTGIQSAIDAGNLPGITLTASRSISDVTIILTGDILLEDFGVSIVGGGGSFSQDNSVFQAFNAVALTLTATGSSEKYQIYGIPLVAANEAIIVTIS